MFRSLSLSSLQFSMSKDILTSKGSSNLWAGLFKATFPESLPVRMSPLWLFEWDYLPSLFEEQRPLQRMLQPFQGGGFVSRPRLINPALLFFSFIFPPFLLVQLLSCKVFPPGCWWQWKERTCCRPSAQLVQPMAWTPSCPGLGSGCGPELPCGTCTHRSRCPWALGAAGGHPAPAEVPLEGTHTQPRCGWRQASPRFGGWWPWSPMPMLRLAPPQHRGTSPPFGIWPAVAPGFE